MSSFLSVLVKVPVMTSQPSTQYSWMALFSRVEFKNHQQSHSQISDSQDGGGDAYMSLNFGMAFCVADDWNSYWIPVVLSWRALAVFNPSCNGYLKKDPRALSRNCIFLWPQLDSSGRGARSIPRLYIFCV